VVDEGVGELVFIHVVIVVQDVVVTEAEREELDWPLFQVVHGLGVGLPTKVQAAAGDVCRRSGSTRERREEAVTETIFASGWRASLGCADRPERSDQRGSRGTKTGRAETSVDRGHGNEFI
jgi:hypothetical protein